MKAAAAYAAATQQSPESRPSAKNDTKVEESPVSTPIIQHHVIKVKK